MTDAIRLTGVGKRYWKLSQQAMLLRSLIPFARPKREELWALKGVDLAVEQGEAVGILGRNGAGKTTLLRLLAGVTRPSEGELVIRGRVAPLIGVGVGFHQEMSGRENVLVNGMLLGLSKEQIDERFADIVGFAELGDFIDTPVKFYSSGMFMRLGFAVAIHTEPNVLLIDEVLAVGDLAFQAKCFRRMRAIREKGTTVVVVSHSAQAIRSMCRRTIVMRNGSVAFDGDTEKAIARHYELLSIDPPAESDWSVGLRLVGGVRVIERRLLGPDGPANFVEPNTPLTLNVRVAFDRDVDSPVFNFGVVGDDGTILYGLRTPVDAQYRAFAAGSVADVKLRFWPRVGGGAYRVSFAVHSSDAREHYLLDMEGVRFFVPARPARYGLADLEGTLEIDGVEVAHSAMTNSADGAAEHFAGPVTPES